MEKRFNREREISASPAIPDVYRLIERAAPLEEIISQSYRDFSNNNLEAVGLGLEEVLARGSEGMKAAKALSKGTDEFSSVLNRVLVRPDWSINSIVDVLGIKRFGSTIYDQNLRNENTLEYIYTYCLKLGYLQEKLTLDDFIENFDEQASREEKGFGIPPHISGEIESQIVSTSSSFGAEEPSYIELTGPREILRLRSMQSPNFLLLGSYGPYSARELTTYAKKINPESKVNVIDNNNEVIDLIKKVNTTDTRITAGDATAMPFVDESMDHVYTSHLLRYMRTTDRNFEQKARFVFTESNRVLKPGGSLVLLEAFEKHSGMGALIDMYATDAGFKIAFELNESISYPLRKEAGTGKISENGFGHYEHTLIHTIPLNQRGKFIRFVKQ